MYLCKQPSGVPWRPLWWHGKITRPTRHPPWTDMPSVARTPPGSSKSPGIGSRPSLCGPLRSWQGYSDFHRSRFTGRRRYHRYPGGGGEKRHRPASPLVTPGKHIRHRALDFSAGSVLLEAGRTIDGVALAHAAASGAATLCVSRAPRIAILCGGDELSSQARHLGHFRYSNPVPTVWRASSRSGAALPTV